MPQSALRLVLTPEERETLTAWSRSSSGEHRLVERSSIILLAAEGLSAREIARWLNTRLARVSQWRQRFSRHRLAGLEDGAEIRQTEDLRQDPRKTSPCITGYRSTGWLQPVERSSAGDSIG